MLKSASTHDVLNQAAADRALQRLRGRPRAARGARARGRRLGRRPRCATPASWPAAPRRIEHAERAERNEPILRTHDRYGNRIDEVELDPSWHWMLRQAIEREIHSLPWRDPQPGAHVVRAALFVVWSQVGSGVMCPVSMTYAAIPALRENAELAAEWEPRLTRPELRRRRPGRHGDDREAGRLGRARQHHARRARRRRHLRDHRPQVVLLLSPVRRLPDARPGARRALVLPVRGRATRASASSGSRTSSARARCRRARSSSTACAARLIGEEGRGVRDDHPHGQPHPPRLPARLGRRDALGPRPGRAPRPPPQRLRQAARRPAAMQNVLADLAVESEAATVTALRIARSYDEDDAGLPPLRDRGREVLGLQARAPRTRPRRSSASAATATSRSRACRGSTATRRSTRSGRARATSRRSTCCARPSRSPRGCRPSWPSASSARGGNALLDAHLDRLAARAGSPTPTAVAGAPDRRGPGAGAAGEPAGAPRAAGGGRRLLRRPARRGRARLRHAAGRRRRAGDRRAGAGGLGGRDAVEQHAAGLHRLQPQRAEHERPRRPRSPRRSRRRSPCGAQEVAQAGGRLLSTRPLISVPKNGSWR